jgi:aconitate hydratase
MGSTIVQKILEKKIREGEAAAGNEIGIRIDQTLVHDSTGPMAFLQFEAMGIDRVRTKKSMVYIDHNTLQPGFENADDHIFLQTAAARFGAYFSRPGNGICHQVQLERFSVPGQSLLGADSHTPSSGGIGMLAIGAGGLDVAVAMGGGLFYLTVPKTVMVRLVNRLPDLVAAKDIILEVLRRISVKGGTGKILEYAGEGLKTLTVPERATIANMGTETGALTSIFPSDDVTRDFLARQDRKQDWEQVVADGDAVYDETLEIDLAALKPMIASPHLPDNVVPVEEVKGQKLNQVVIGSCTNASYEDMMRSAQILAGKKVHPDVSLVVAPGSRQVLSEIIANGALAKMVDAGARILESACGPCVGMGQAPCSGGVSLRTVNRNFKGRSGTADAEIYLCSPETAAASAIAGEITDPRETGIRISRGELPEKFALNDSLFIPPDEKKLGTPIVRGPNIKPLPTRKDTLDDTMSGPVLITLGDNITTDDILPAGAKILPLRSNIPAISEYVFSGTDPEFVSRIKKSRGGFIVGGENYGQGSSREHAALAPMYLGVKAVLALSYARIHKSNLVNFGILPLVVPDRSNLSTLEMGDTIEIKRVNEQIKKGETIRVDNRSKQSVIETELEISERQKDVLLAGGLLNYTRKMGA